jgi:hypothetical protein
MKKTNSLKMVTDLTPTKFESWCRGIGFKMRAGKLHIQFHPYTRRDFKFDYELKTKYPVLCKL